MYCAYIMPFTGSYLLVNFVEHSRVVVFFWVVVETDHAILLVDTSIDLTIFNLQRTEGVSENAQDNRRLI